MQVIQIRSLLMVNYNPLYIYINSRTEYKKALKFDSSAIRHLDNQATLLTGYLNLNS